jgi:hypothetical protein
MRTVPPVQARIASGRRATYNPQVRHLRTGAPGAVTANPRIT